MSLSVPKPKYRIGDQLVASTHPNQGMILMRVTRAWRDVDKTFQWIYMSEDGQIVYETNVEYKV